MVSVHGRIEVTSIVTQLRFSSAQDEKVVVSICRRKKNNLILVHRRKMIKACVLVAYMPVRLIFDKIQYIIS